MTQSQFHNALFVNTGAYIRVGVLGLEMRVYDASGADYMSFDHDGTDGIIKTNAGRLDCKPASGAMRVYEAAGADYTEINHSGANATLKSFPGNIYLDSRGSIVRLKTNTGASSNMRLIFSNTTDSALCEVVGQYQNARQGLLVTYLNGGMQWIVTSSFNNHDHGTQTNPALFVHSATAPDTANDEFIGLTHDQTNPVISWGSGELVLTDGASNSLTLTNAGALATDICTSTQLKTSQGEVSTTNSAFTNVTLPGAEHGFYPQTKMGTTNTEAWSSTISGTGISTYAGWTSYKLNISLKADGTNGMFARQRYVTSSGADYWIFLLVKKGTGEIIATYSAPDHPMYGNGGDINEVPHPFVDNDLAQYDVVILGSDEILSLAKQKKSRNDTFASMIHKKFKVDMSVELPYQALHTGQFIDKKPVKIQNLPVGIKVRKLKLK